MIFTALKTIFLSSLIVCTLTTRSFALEDAIIAVVNSEVITLKDLRDYINSTYVALVTQGFDNDQIKEIMDDLEKNGLNKLIEDKLILTEANQMELEVNEKAIQQKIDEIKTKYPSEEAFLKALIEHGGTLTDMYDKIKEQLKIKYIIDLEIKDKIFVNPQEITDFYEKNLDSFHEKEQVQLDSIYIAFGSNKISSKAKAEEALSRLQKGEDFKIVAKEVSDTPSIGTVERGQLMPSLEKKIFHLQPNTPSEIIEVESGFYIFTLIERLPSKVTPLDEVKESIKDKLFRQKFREKFSKWLGKLKDDAYIDIKK